MANPVARPAFLCFPHTLLYNPRMSYLGQLRALESAGLIRLAATQPELEYTFRHALLQEAAYQTLSKFARTAAHRAVAEALEAQYAGEAADHHYGDLAYHYAEAGQWDRTLDFAFRAGQREQEMYAPREALAHYDRALEAARRLRLSPPGALLRARGQVLETLGRLAEARASFEQALAQARAAHDQRAEWQSLQDLGFLWAASDYAQAGECFHVALALARTIGDPACLGHSLNRVGNWHTNNDEPEAAQQYHQEALALFERLGDTHSLAQTYDLLGLSTALAGDQEASGRYLPRAIELFHQVGDRPGYISARSIYMLRTLTYETVVIATDDMRLDAIQQTGDEIRAMTRAIGLRSAEAFLLHILAIAYGPRGAYDFALPAGQESLRIAEEIQHRQWTVAGHYSLGALYLDVLAWPLARRHLETALTLAQQANSTVWQRIVGGLLAQACVAEHRSQANPDQFVWQARPRAEWPPLLAAAQVVVNQVQDLSAPLQTFNQAMVWLARGHLALACGDANQALACAHQLEEFNTRRPGPAPVIPVLKLLRAEALVALGRPAEAIAALETARGRAEQQGARPLLWRLHRRLAQLYAGAGQPAAAQSAEGAARALIAELAQTLPAGELREGFLAQVLAD